MYSRVSLLLCCGHYLEHRHVDFLERSSLEVSTWRMYVYVYINSKLSALFLLSDFLAPARTSEVFALHSPHAVMHTSKAPSLEPTIADAMKMKKDEKYFFAPLITLEVIHGSLATVPRCLSPLPSLRSKTPSSESLGSISSHRNCFRLFTCATKVMRVPLVFLTIVPRIALRRLKDYALTVMRNWTLIS